MEKETSNPLTPYGGNAPNRISVNEAVFYTHCVVCGTLFKNEDYLSSVGHPFCILLHKHCYPFFDYGKGWPHPLPLQYYKNKSCGIFK